MYLLLLLDFSGVFPRQDYLIEMFFYDPLWVMSPKPLLSKMV
jgi:hypothetical protein